MELLQVKHTDFTLTFECEDWQKRWEKGVRLLGGAHHLTSTYTCSAPCTIIHTDENGHREDIIEQGATNPQAFFFEQTDYSVWVDFKDGVTEAHVETSRQDVNRRFVYKKGHNVLAGFLNYDNEIGRADFPLAYTRNGEQKHFVLSYDVLSAKLDYHHDWKIILRDIEEEYRMLSLDYLRKTYHGISEGEGESFDLIWWNIFHGLQDEFIRATRNIIERPRHRLRSVSSFKRADQIRLFTPILEQQFAEHRNEEQRQYLVEEQQTSHNTIENRFLKYTLGVIEERYKALANRILRELNLPLSDTEKEHIQKTKEQLLHLTRHPFFRNVGKFEGLKQESLILQRDVNYSKIYRTSVILRKSFNLNDGMYRMETKDIATLYEIWCFIQVEKVVRELFPEDITIEHPNRTEMNGIFTQELGKGEHSRIVFRQGDITLAELIYNPRHDAREDDVRGIGDLESPTVPQKPDIVLQLTKDDLQRGMNLTYLFDAKYRVETDRKTGRDVPPQDAINQMHRYRDAIYYSKPQVGRKKEVLGGYILFPGEMEDTDHFRQTVDEVNIGAFPMRPGDTEHEMLKAFIKDLMQQNAVEIVEQVIPQKGLYYTTEPTNSVQPKNIFTGLIRKDDEYAEKYVEHKAKEYLIEKEPKVNILQAKYLLPMVNGCIDGYYRITNLRVKEEKILLRLGDFIPLGEEKVPIMGIKMQPGELINLEYVHKLYKGQI